MDIEDGGAHVLDTAWNLCASTGMATAEDVAAITGQAVDLVRAQLIGLVNRGDLIARPGGQFARGWPFGSMAVKGASLSTDLARPSLAAMMGAR